MLDGSALESEWTQQLPKSDMNIIVMDGVLEYFSKEQVKTCLNMLCDSFAHGYLLAECIPLFWRKTASITMQSSIQMLHSAGEQSPVQNIWRLSLE